MELKKLTRLSMLLALSVVLSLIESMVPIINGIIPGVKLGLANIVVLVALYIYGFKDALSLTILRVFLIGILRTGLFGITFFFSFSGSIFSICAMVIFKKYTKLSIIGVSIIGSVFHSIGQILIASIILNNANVMYYLPWISLFSIFTGIIVGYISKEIVNFLLDN